MPANKTFGDFLDEVAKTDSTEGRIWLEEFKKMAPSILRTMPLRPGLVIIFTHDIVGLFQERMSEIGTDLLWQSTLRRGYAFLHHIEAVAERYDVDVHDIVNQPITHVEAVARAQAS